MIPTFTTLSKLFMTKNSSDENKEYLSPKGFHDLRERLGELKTKKRVEIARHLEYAKSLGDLSENAEYDEAKEEQMANEAEIRQLEDLLSRAEVIANTQSAEIRVGSVVSFQCRGDGTGSFTIVGREEADPSQGKISNESPLGRAFLGHKKNEKILASTPKGEIEYHIIDIA